ncbi:hypothetical protein [Aromatoleum evansii]|uniref:hypothetical protein n=1 Tax=Aromatoleum evansii TaxID=59406 RepID=UPI00145D93EE|nr:hypothetical protein [Aromatoleum evansii]NMG31089.1 hypothetical protein [Aromatoleum evansii]
MTKKQQLLTKFIARDRSGAALRTHETLLAHGFKWKDRGETLMYFSRTADGRELGLLAMRPGVISFPANFWNLHAMALDRALHSVGSSKRIPVDDGWFTTSQYSAAQIALEPATESAITDIIREIVVPEGLSAGARLAASPPTLG